MRADGAMPVTLGPPQAILGERYRFEMSRVYTQLIGAKMIDVKTLWNRPMDRLIGKPVSQGSAVHSVAVSTDTSGPNPARSCLFHLA